MWAERYDRELTDIFDIQDEISKAIAAALKLRLLPKEKKAIEQRGTNSADAYNLYLMARQHWITGNIGDSRRDEVSVRICRQAIAIDPDYAKAWALMALAQAELRFRHGRDVDPLPAAERALDLDSDLAEAHCIKARYLQEEGRDEEASQLVDTALRLDPDFFEANKEAGRLRFRQGNIKEALAHFLKAASLMDDDYHDTGMMITCYQALGDPEGVRRAAEMTKERAEKAVAQDASNGAALGYGAVSLAVLGDPVRAREWIDRALMIDPENNTMRYNLACSLATYLKDTNAALELLGPYFERVSVSELKHCAADPDMDPLRGDLRFQQMAAAASARLASGVAQACVPTPSD